MADETPDTQPVPEVAETAAAATHPPEAVRLGLPDGPQSKPGKPLEKGGQGDVTVRTRWPIDSFEHGLKGVPVVTATGVAVPRAKAGALIEKAAEAGIELEEVEA